MTAAVLLPLLLLPGPQSTFSCILFLIYFYLFTHRPLQDLPGAHVLPSQREKLLPLAASQSG